MRVALLGNLAGARRWPFRVHKVKALSVGGGVRVGVRGLIENVNLSLCAVCG